MNALAARVIGIGRDVAGDDGVGPAVLRALGTLEVPPGVELHVASDPTGIIPLLETRGLVILVDAILGAEPGCVLDLDPEELEQQGVAPVSTHGVGVMQALALARALSPGTLSPAIRIVGIGIAPPQADFRLTLSPPVAAAVPLAAQAVLQLLKGRSHA